MTPRPKAVLLAVKLPELSDDEFVAQLKELERLVTTLGYEAVGTITQARSHLDPGAVVGEGKLKELARLTGGTGHVGTTAPKPKDKARIRREAQDPDAEDPDTDTEDPGGDTEDPGGDAEPGVELVAVDHELTPSQARNLERATDAQVLDRTGVIIEIFHRHAKSRAARLQVEIARLKYSVPRLRESPGGKERQRGRGAGEAALELDRRKVRDRIAELREELEALAKDDDHRRAGRREARRVALVGYTNAGKSSLMRALTGSEVYVENKLFATLDTTVRALTPEAKPRILVSDTVGFIKHLPHDLVASFKSTLDEALEASLLLHVIDASDPSWPSQRQVTESVLAEIKAGAVPQVLVFNKMDAVDPSQRDTLLREHPGALFISAHDPADVSRVRDHIVAFFEERYETADLLVPYTMAALLSELHGSGRVENTTYEDGGTRVSFRADPDTVARFRAKLAAT